MAHTCSCHGATAPAPTPSAVTSAQTVEEVAHRSPAALDVLKRMGINHCCGGHLTLGEAAAAAGVETRTLLAALNDALGTPA